MPSLPPVSQKVIADVEQYLAQWKRMERETSSGATRIDREVGQLTKGIAKKFQLGDLGKDLLKGAGLFGGMQIAETVANMVQDHFRKAAEFAKSMEESTARSLEHVRKSIAARQTDEQQLASLLKQRTELANDLARLKTPDAVTRTTGSIVRGEDLRRTVTSTLPISPETQQEIKKTTHALEALGEAIDALNRKLADKKQTDAAKDAAATTRVWNEQLRIQEKTFDDLVAAKKKDNDETARVRAEAEKLAEKYRELADPTLHFKKQIEEINALMADGKLKFEEGARAIDAVKDAMKRDEKTRIERELEDFFKDMDAKSKATAKVSDTARELGLAFSSAFEDAILNGEKLGDVLKSLEKDLLRLLLRKTVTEPLFNWVGGIFGGTGGTTSAKTPGFAHGGDFTVGGAGGTDSQLVAFRATPGEAVHVRTPGQQTGQGGALAPAFIFAPQIAAGVTRDELGAMMPAMFDQFSDMLADKVSRGGAYAQAFR